MKKPTLIPFGDTKTTHRVNKKMRILKSLSMLKLKKTILETKNIILKGKLSSCEEENYRLEKTIGSLKEQLEDYEKLKAGLDHTKGELLLTS